MKKGLWLFLLLSLVCVCMMMGFTGCSSSSSSSTSPSTPVDVTGDWEVAAVGWGNLVYHLTQDAQGNITGTIDRSAADGGTDTGTVTSGSNVDNNITINAVFDDGMTLSLTGRASDANNMSGTYTDSQGSSDAWSATRRV